MSVSPRSLPQRSRCILALLSSALVCGSARPAAASRIDAQPGRTYALTKQHGPWMILVASFNSTSPDGQIDEGKTPEQAANELVYELRVKGVPAYAYELQPERGELATVDRLGQPVRKHVRRQSKSVCVLAGNYPAFDDDVAQQTLEWTKKFNPKSLQDGVTFVPTPGRPQPLSAAFLCINPLLNPEEIAAQRVDPLLRELNHGVRHSLADNPGQYTLQVATFAGKSVTELKTRVNPIEFLKDNDLDDAAQQANDLAVALRQDLDSRPGSPFRNLDAYVWHDRHESIVTVGSFRGPDDPNIERYLRIFAAAPHPTTGKPDFKYLTIGRPENPSRIWAFVPTPQTIRVPKLR